jgi:hypothetical protein
MARKQLSIVVFGMVIVGTILGYVSLTGPHGRIVARLQQEDKSGFKHSVTVRQFGGRFRTELSEGGSYGRGLPVSSYEFYEDSYAITTATIIWPELHRFSVGFDNSETVECLWSETNAVWRRH